MDNYKKIILLIIPVVLASFHDCGKKPARLLDNSFRIKITQPVSVYEIEHEITYDSIKVRRRIRDLLKSRFPIEKMGNPLFRDTLLYQSKLTAQQKNQISQFISTANFDTLRNEYLRVSNPIKIIVEVDVDEKSRNITLESYYHPPVLRDMIKMVDSWLPSDNQEIKIHPNADKERERGSKGVYELLTDGKRSYTFGKNVIETNRLYTLEQYHLKEDWYLELQRTNSKGYTFRKVVNSVKKDTIDFKRDYLPAIEKLEIFELLPLQYEIAHFTNRMNPIIDTIQLK